MAKKKSFKKRAKRYEVVKRIGAPKEKPGVYVDKAFEHLAKAQEINLLGVNKAIKKDYEAGSKFYEDPLNEKNILKYGKLRDSFLTEEQLKKRHNHLIKYDQYMAIANNAKFDKGDGSMMYNFRVIDDYVETRNKLRGIRKRLEPIPIKGTFSLILIIAGMFFISPNLTGNAIANLTTKTSSIIGAGLFIVGMVGSYFWFKKK